ncbi:MAG: 4Fe-4S binding protein [Planctomycetota bacterium]|nr:4Fe-4S binding protein [Planctomycetota bacterium]MDA1250973.1 4Fe-4S binding protein [Planctomycetota bacterium]
MAEAMLPVELEEVTNPFEPGDELLTAAELASLSLFEDLKKTPSFARFPGSTFLRKCKKGRALVRQGESGATAYSILTSEDVLQLRERQLVEIRKTLEQKKAGQDGSHTYYRRESAKSLNSLAASFESEIAALRVKVAQYAASSSKPAERHVATAHLIINFDRKQKPGLLHRLGRLFSGGPTKAAIPSKIPIDGPSDIDVATKQAPLHEGELFGEMSCLNRAPRSATVMADEDCYMLEMLRNVLDMLHNDEKYSQKLDAVYRERVLDGHIRRLSIFQDLPEEEFNEIRERIELVDFPAGSVVFEEFDESDSFYIVRSGLVKVVKNAWTLIRTEEFKPDNWKKITTELAAHAKGGFGENIWVWLPEEVQAAVNAGKLDSDSQTKLIEALNRLIKEAELHTAIGKTTESVISVIDSPQLTVDCEDFPDETKGWSELERRTFHRSLLEHLLPEGLPRRAASCGARRTLTYLGRGDDFGELGVETGEPRSATIFAYDHPDGGANMRLPDSRTGAVPSRAELVKISKEDFQSVVNRSKKLKQKVQDKVAGFRAKAEKQKTPVGDRVEVRSQSPEFEQLGLIQGQRLMLIDLDRCTRCNQCVEACVSSHEDGRTRLYLDGPRFEKYLVPLTCRSCLDPVCMIGCPVGAINRGENSEIQITDWCIGCELCADQCPYGSIQMNSLPGDVELSGYQKALLGGSETKSVSKQAVVCDLCSSLSKQEPSCVYACPHDAAMRVSALEFFFEE